MYDWETYLLRVNKQTRAITSHYIALLADIRSSGPRVTAPEVNVWYGVKCQPTQSPRPVTLVVVTRSSEMRKKKMHAFNQKPGIYNLTMLI